MNGSDEEKSSKAIASVLGNTMLLTQMEKASVDAILKTKDRRLKEEDVKAAISQAIRDSEDILTVGQYIQPSKKHLEVEKYYTLEEFEKIKDLAKKVGFKNFQIGPLVRSSYMAKDLI